MEKSPKLPSAQERYEQLHQRIAEKLGESYKSEKIDAIAAAIGFENLEGELEAINLQADSEENKRLIDEWYKSHNDILEMFGK